jgi:hypothetical protein
VQTRDLKYVVYRVIREKKLSGAVGADMVGPGIVSPVLVAAMVFFVPKEDEQNA